jgi:hypothetical protein
MTLYRVWDGNPPKGLPQIPQEVKNFVDKQGRYEVKFTKENKFIAVFGANATHLTGCAEGKHSGDGQAGGVKDCKNVMPLDTMYYARNEGDVNGRKTQFTRKALLETIHYQFAEMEKRPNTPFIIPYKVLNEGDLSILKSTKAKPYKPNTNETYTAIISDDCQNKQDVQKWLNGLKVGSTMVNMGFGICRAPDIEALYEINTLAEQVIAKQVKNKAQGSSKVAAEIATWQTDVLQNVANIKNGLPAAAQQAGNNIEKFTTVLQQIRTQNEDLAQLTAENLISIFTYAAKAEYYTKAPIRKQKLPLDASGGTLNTKEAKLMRKFSVKFQEECRDQKLYFSNTNGCGNRNGMRTKSVLAFLNQKNNNGNIENLIKQVWEK